MDAVAEPAEEADPVGAFSFIFWLPKLGELFSDSLLMVHFYGSPMK